MYLSKRQKNKKVIYNCARLGIIGSFAFADTLTVFKRSAIGEGLVVVKLKDMKRCISNCDEDIIRYTNNIDSLGSTHFEISMLKYMSGLDNKTDAAIITALTEYLQGKILEAKELKQSCNDELHWLEVRIGI